MGGKASFLPYFLGSFSLSIFGLIFLIFGSAPLIEAFKSGNILLFAFPHFWIGLALFIGAPLYAFLVYKYIGYSITDKRVLIQGGLFGRSFEMVDHDQITNADVKGGFVNKVFGKNSGSILISTAGTLTYTRQGTAQKPYTLRNITDPYAVFKFFKEVSHDVKTDIEYPNELRPKENLGYKTEYKGDQNNQPSTT